MKKLLLIAVVIAGTSALVLAGRGGGFGWQGFANGPVCMQLGPGGFGRRGFADRPGPMRPGPGGRGPYGPLCNWQDDTTPPLMLGILDLTDEQKETITNLVEESRAKLHADIEAVLMDEQVGKLQQLRDENENRPFAGLDLTEEQKTAIAEIREKARADAEAAETREAGLDIMQAAHDEILAVLTDEQIEKLEQLRASRPYGPGKPGRGYPAVGPRGSYAGPDGPLAALDLTEEQEALIAEIRENARADAEAAETREARREIIQAAHDEILSVLTDEQIEKLEQLCPRMPWGRSGSGRGRW
jgi:Spy/CpxP family protein refolding chaperone